MNLSRRFFFLLIAVLALPALAASQEGFSLFTTDFPPEEFAQRRAEVYKAIGEGNVALVQGAPMPAGYTRFRQSNEFYYLCGIETPHAYLLLNGTTKRATVYLPHRHEARERSEGKVLSAEDNELVRELSGIDAVSSTDMLAEHLARMAWTSSVKVIYTPFQPAEGFAMSRDLAVRVMADYAADPFDGRGSREAHFVGLLRSRFPQFEIKDLSPILDELRLIKSPREIALIRKATRLSGLALIEGMRSAKPGVYEYELDAMAKYIYYRNGAQGEAYYSLIASGPNAMFGHYNAGKRQMKEGEFLLFDFAPDVGYYMADVTRMIPVGKFTDWQQELYGFYLSCYRSIIKAIKPNLTAQVIRQAAAKEMESVLSKAKFSKPNYEKAAKQFVENYKQGTNNPYATLGHWVGMATHDVGSYRGPLKPGMVFTIEPALRVPEEHINIRLEDMLLITEKGVENMSEFVPMDIDAIEKIMQEEGMVQRYPADK
jgi:Xaa-Pro aminopeptidase